MKACLLHGDRRVEELGTPRLRFEPMDEHGILRNADLLRFSNPGRRWWQRKRRWEIALTEVEARTPTGDVVGRGFLTGGPIRLRSGQDLVFRPGTVELKVRYRG